MTTSLTVLGQPYWGSIIARALNEVGKRSQDGIRASFVGQAGYVRLLANPTRAGSSVFVRVGFRVGATTSRGRLFDAYWAALRRRFPRARFCHYWIGTDVENTVAEVRNGTVRGGLARAHDEVHVAAAPWLADELRDVGLTASVAFVPVGYRTPPMPTRLPTEFSVLSYMPEGRFVFYGGPVLIEAARALDDVRFDIVGARAVVPAPQNVRWLGWVQDMGDAYERSTVVLRIPRHDALGATVIEGLLHARHVIYTHELPWIRHVPAPTGEAVVRELARLRDEQRAGSLELNRSGREWAISTFDQRLLAGSLLAELTGTDA